MRFRRELVAGAALFIALCGCADAHGQQAAVVDEADHLLQQGQAFAGANRLAEAEAALVKAALLAPGDLQIITLLAQVKSRLGDSKEAVTLFGRVVQARPKSAEAHLNLAIALADTQDAPEALRETEAAIRLEPHHARAHLNRARLLADVNRSTEARAEFLQADRLTPDNSEVEYFWGVFEKEAHQWSAAASLLAKVVAQQPNNVRAWFLLGQTQQSLGRSEEAIVSWRRAFALDERSEETVFALSQALRSTRPQEASELLERFHRLHTEKQKEEQVRELGNQAYFAMRHEQWQSAIATLQQALDVCGTCSLQADLHQRLGLAECHSGDLDKGERELRLALSLNPNDRETVTALQWVANQRR